MNIINQNDNLAVFYLQKKTYKDNLPFRAKNIPLFPTIFWQNAVYQLFCLGKIFEMGLNLKIIQIPDWNVVSLPWPNSSSITRWLLQCTYLLISSPIVVIAHPKKKKKPLIPDKGITDFPLLLKTTCPTVCIWFCWSRKHVSGE